MVVCFQNCKHTFGELFSDDKIDLNAEILFEVLHCIN